MSDEQDTIGTRIVREVRENIGRLDSCKRHTFRKIDPKMFTRYVCDACGGTVDGSSAHWYNRGIRDASQPQPVTPWMSDAEIALIESHLASGMNVLEWGAGGSTLRFPRLVANYHSIEHNKAWHTKIAAATDRIENVAVWLCENDTQAFQGEAYPPGYLEAWTEYVQFPRTIGLKFDVILIDGRARLYCAMEALNLLAPGGVVFIHDFFQRPRYHAALEHYNEIARIPHGQSLIALRKK